MGGGEWGEERERENKCVLKMRREPSEKTAKETLKAERERKTESEREKVSVRLSMSVGATCHFSTMA